MRFAVRFLLSVGPHLLAVILLVPVPTLSFAWALPISGVSGPAFRKFLDLRVLTLLYDMQEMLKRNSNNRYNPVSLPCRILDSVI